MRSLSGVSSLKQTEKVEDTTGMCESMVSYVCDAVTRAACLREILADCMESVLPFDCARSWIVPASGRFATGLIF